MQKSYTGTGDLGESSLGDGTRHQKSHAVFDAVGSLDEANSVLGIAKSEYALQFQSEDEQLLQIQKDLFLAGAIVSCAKKADEAQKFGRKLAQLEAWIDEIDAKLPPLKHFILDGGTPLASRLHHARATTRRAERRVCAIGKKEYAPVLKYLNRLSSYLFARARFENFKAGVKEIEWAGD